LPFVPITVPASVPIPPSSCAAVANASIAVQSRRSKKRLMMQFYGVRAIRTGARSTGVVEEELLFAGTGEQWATAAQYL
jgi:hypothetical protein